LGSTPVFAWIYRSRRQTVAEETPSSAAARGMLNFSQQYRRNTRIGVGAAPTSSFLTISMTRPNTFWFEALARYQISASLTAHESSVAAASLGQGCVVDRHQHQAPSHSAIRPTPLSVLIGLETPPEQRTLKGMKPIHYAALLLAFAIIPVNAQPWIGPYAFQDWQYCTQNGNAMITAYTGPGGNVVIPRTINGLPVTRLYLNDGNGIFYYCTNLTSIVIPDTVRLINPFTFWGCTSLRAIYFMGDIPSPDPSNMGSNLLALGHVPPQMIFYYLPWRTGWGSTYSERQTAVWNPMDWLAFLLEQDGVTKSKPLLASLSAAESAIERGKLGSAVNKLRAFQNKVRAQVRSADLARKLVDDAQYVADWVGSD
jgi:hypothetical protein